jgi:cytochrome c553
VFYGNLHGGITMLDAKPIPGSDKIVSIFSPDHGRPEHLGPVTIVNPNLGPDDRSAARQISKGSDWKDPYAFSEDCFLVANRKGIFVMDGTGESELIYQLPLEESHLQVHEPRPIMPRPYERVIPNRVNLTQPTGELFLQDIYHGRNMTGVKRGDIKKLLVLKQLPKPINFSGGMEPLTIGGSFTLAEIVGEVPVEADGSAYMEVPALQSLFFVALDKNDIAVKRMHSFVTVQPGETTGCIGCHEQRQTTLHTGVQLSQAMRRTPTPVAPIKDVPSVLDYPRDIQPILDRRCVSCHNPDKRDGGVDLSGDKTAMYTISYWTMRTRNLVNDARNEPRSNRDPYSYGSATSRLVKLIDGSHYKAVLTDLERKTVRLWIETSATYPGTYASLGCGFYFVGLPMTEMMQRCGQCHTENVKDRKGKIQPRLVFNNEWGYRTEPFSNLTRPEKSLILRAPLAKEAGGFGLCEEVSFKDTADPLYKQILASIQNARDRLVQGKRFDMPGFRPNEHYIREMQRFGFLPKNLAPDAPIDIYATDRAYWDSFNYRANSSVLSSR